MTLKARVIPCLDVKDARDARSGNAARTRKLCEPDARSGNAARTRTLKKAVVR